MEERNKKKETIDRFLPRENFDPEEEKNNRVRELTIRPITLPSFLAPLITTRNSNIYV